MLKGRILIADDERTLVTSLRNLLTQAGYDVAAAASRTEIQSVVPTFNPDMILLDVYLGADNGIQILKELRQDGWRMPVVIMTANSEVSVAVAAMKEGAADFIEKPFDANHMRIVVEKNLEFARLESRVRMLQEELEVQRSRSGIIGKSAALTRVLAVAEKLAGSENTTVLLEGESGTGKELIARFIHQQSGRADRPFIAFNCAAIPRDLAESEFFGYERGAFTGAIERMKQGKFELANGGTILLDEVGELSLDMQVKLLRVLEEKKFYRLGGTRELAIDVRVVAATNRNLAKETEAGRFREDLFYRLNVATISIPPLRERKEDIDALAYAFLKEFSAKFNRSAPRLTSDATELLRQLPWKGNVRELRNAIERVVLLNDGPQIETEHFAFLTGGVPRKPVPVAVPSDGAFLMVPSHGLRMNDVLKELIMKTLDLTDGNQVKAAKVLGVTRSKLRYKMDQLGIKPELRSYKVDVH